MGGLEQPVALGQLAAQVGGPQLGPDPREQLLHLVGALGLLDVVVGPRFQAGDLVLRLSQGREHEDRDRPQFLVFLDFLAEPGAVELGHLVVGQDQLGPGLFVRLGQPFHAVIGRLDLIALFLEHHRQHPPHRGAVFNKQEPTRRHEPILLHGLAAPAQSRSARSNRSIERNTSL